MTVTGLNAKQERALLALLNEPTIAAAAVAAGVSESTLFRWLREPLFADAYRSARRASVKQAVGQLQRVSWSAASVLTQIMADPQVAPAVRLGAASKVLDLAIHAVETEDLDARLAALEAKYGAQL